MTLWMALRDRAEIGRVARRWRATGPVGLASAAGSACWFAAFAMQSAALVKTVGQVEILLSLLVGRLAFGERPGRRELAGIALLGASILGVVLIG
jgi:drug/metabolite transporter (DMT)-like permease